MLSISSHGNDMTPIIPTLDIYPEAQVIGLESVKGRFLLEGASYLGHQQIGFVNIYNATALDQISGNKGENSKIYWLDLSNGELHTRNLPRDLCATAVVPTVNPAILVVVTNQGIFTLDKNQEELKLWHRPSFIDQWPAGTRSNDSRIDPEGNLLISWMGEGAHRDSPGSRQGELWLIRPDKTETLLASNLYIPNGHAFIPNHDGTYRMFYNDTARTFKHPELPRAVDEYHYNPTIGVMERKGAFFTFPGGDDVKEFPDGMAISADHKSLLIPMFFGGGVDVINIEECSLMGRIKTPGAEQSTSIALLTSGEAIITTAAEFYASEDFKNNPNAGSIFHVDLADLGIQGAEPYKFKLSE